MKLLFLPFQILILLFLIFAFSRVILRFRERSIGAGAFLFWSGIWLLAIVGVLEPEFTTWFANKLGVGRGVDVIIYISLLMLFYLMYRTNVYVENIRHEITQLTRQIALDKLGKEKNQKRKIKNKIS